jgi:phosphoribosylformylglycinamidine synthase
MKAKIIITPKRAVVDPQGKTVQNALAYLGYQGVTEVHVGKYLEIGLTGNDPAAARQALDEACHRFLSNPVIEDYHLEIECPPAPETAAASPPDAGTPAPRP